MNLIYANCKNMTEDNVSNILHNFLNNLKKFFGNRFSIFVYDDIGTIGNAEHRN